MCPTAPPRAGAWRQALPSSLLVPESTYTCVKKNWSIGSSNCYTAVLACIRYTHTASRACLLASPPAAARLGARFAADRVQSGGRRFGLPDTGVVPSTGTVLRVTLMPGRTTGSPTCRPYCPTPVLTRGPALHTELLGLSGQSCWRSARSRIQRPKPSC